MKNIETYTGKLENLERLKSSDMGNPRYECTIGGQHCRTSVDDNLAYVLPNYEGREVVATIGEHYNYMTIDSIRPKTRTVKRKAGSMTSCPFEDIEKGRL